MTGLSLAHYRIDEELGRGGMGIVYQATDTKLDRTVALKVLPPHAMASADDRARFMREARSAAQLHHPHIATVFEIAEAVPEGAPHGSEPQPYIAMEFIDGEALSDRIARGPMPLEEAVRIASEIADALSAAHEAGVVHRDIKSANVMLTSKGVVKVLDFGLAKTAASTQLTRHGSTLGTMAYMSPEQARGTEVDGRTDLWALGVILYEMIAGRLPFAADYEQAALYAVLNEDPAPLTSIRTGVPMGLEWIVSKLLAKEANNRYQSAGDLLVDLRTVDLESPTLSRISTPSRPAAPPATRSNPLDLRGRLHPALLVACVVAAALLGWWLGSSGSPETEPGTPKRFSQAVPVGGVIATADISNDGRLVALATETIQVMDLSRGTLRTYDVPDVYVYLAFSPDDRRLLLTTASGIRILSLESGAVVDVAETSEGGPRAEWVDAETIIYEDLPSIYERSLTTGAVRQVVPLDTVAGEYDMDFPMMLPDGKTLVATAQYRDEPDRIGFWDLESGENRGYLDFVGARAQYAASGHLVLVMNQSEAVAIPFDLDKLEQTGPVIPIEDEVRPEAFAISQEGTLVHAGPRVGVVAASRPIRPTVIRMTGGSFANEFPEHRFPADRYRNAAVHPSGDFAAVVVEGELRAGLPPESDIYILDFRNGTRRAFTSGAESDAPAWSADGDSLFYVRRNLNQRRLLVKATSGRGGERVVQESGNTEIVDLSVSREIGVAAVGIPGTMDNASRYRVFDLRDSSAEPFRMGSLDRAQRGPGGNPRHFDFSPDGRYIAYEDQGAIYVQSAEDLENPAFTIFENGMTLPRWSADGTSLIAIKVEGGAIRVPVSLEPSFAVTGAEADMTAQWYAFGTTFFDTFPESERFLVGLPEGGAAESDEDVASVELTFIVNLFDELRAANE